MAPEVTFDARAVALPGVGRFVTGLWPALRRRAPCAGIDMVPLVPAGRARGWLGPEALPAPEGGRPVRSQLSWPSEQIELPLVMRGAAAHHSPHLAVPRWSPAPVVLTVHDLFPLINRRHARSATAAAWYRRALPAAVSRAARVVAVSAFTAAQLEDILGLSDVPVVEHGVDAEAWAPLPVEEVDTELAAAGVARPYLLYVGTAKPHKGLATLLAAAGPGLPPLVLAGPTGAEVARSCGALWRGAPGRMTALGRVSDRRLRALYCGAAAVAVPSRYEAVGFAALEAMACGTPVVASDVPGLAATVGDAGALAPAGDPGGWSETLTRVCADDGLRREMVERGRRIVRGRSWDRAADAYVAIYREVAR